MYSPLSRLSTARGLGTWFSRFIPTKFKACKSFLLTESSLVVLLYVHRKTDDFSLSLTFLHSKVAPPPLTNFVIYPLCFLTAFIVTSRLQLFSRERGGASDQKTHTYTTERFCNQKKFGSWCKFFFKFNFRMKQKVLTRPLKTMMENLSLNLTSMIMTIIIIR